MIASDPHLDRLPHGRALADFPGGAPVVTDATAVDSPLPPEAFR